MTTTTTTAARQEAIRYFVVPASTLRGWFVRTVVVVDGKETTGKQEWKFVTKAEAKRFKEDMNESLRG